MSATHVSIIIPLIGPSAELPATLETIEGYLHTTGFAFDIRVLDRRDGADYGTMLRRGAADTAGTMTLVVAPPLPSPVAARARAHWIPVAVWEGARWAARAWPV